MWISSVQSREIVRLPQWLLQSQSQWPVKISTDFYPLRMRCNFSITSLSAVKCLQTYLSFWFLLFLSFLFLICSYYLSFWYFFSSLVNSGSSQSCVGRWNYIQCKGVFQAEVCGATWHGCQKSSSSTKVKKLLIKLYLNILSASCFFVVFFFWKQGQKTSNHHMLASE